LTIASASPAREEQLLGLWKSSDECYVHIFETQVGGLEGATWGKHKESGELTLEAASDRKFPWKRKRKGKITELSPRRKGRFIVDLYDRQQLYSNVSPCLIKMGVTPRWSRIPVDQVAIKKIPEWYRSRFQEIVAAGQTEVSTAVTKQPVDGDGTGG
jgi:hypothetical protein